MGQPGWPGTVGGASSPSWGPYVQLYVYLGIAPGTPMVWGSVAGGNDTLDAGNVWAGAGPSPPVPAPAQRLWIDASCDVLNVATHLGGTAEWGKAEAATCTLSLRDPNRLYDPLNPSSPYNYGRTNRLGPGTPVLVFAETIVAQDTAGAVPLFGGTVDSWAAPWTPDRTKRVTTITASDDVKRLVALDWGEQSPRGAGDTADQRVNRILDYYGWTGARRIDTSTNTLQATTLAQSAWELLGRTADDEIGYVLIDQWGTLQFYARSVWSAPGSNYEFTIGCLSAYDQAGAWYDIAMAAQVEAADLNIVNSAYVSRTGGTQQTTKQTLSMARYGEHSLKRTDLGLQTDPQAAAWAAYVVGLGSWPSPSLKSVTVWPVLYSGNGAPPVWSNLLGLEPIRDHVRVVWQPPGSTDVYDVTGRCLAINQSITHDKWEMKIDLVRADLYGRLLHWGPDTDDLLDNGFTWSP